MRFHSLLLIPLIALNLSAVRDANAQSSESLHLVQCDGSQSSQDFRVCIEQTLAWRLPAGGASGLHCGIALGNNAGACFRVSFDQELRVYRLFPQQDHPEFLISKQNLVQAWQFDATGLYQPKQYSAPVDRLPGGPHDPIRVAIGGSNSAARGAFERAVNQCMITIACITQIDQGLAARAREAWRISGGGLDVGPAGASISYTHMQAQLHAPTELMFCDDMDTCALVQWEAMQWQFRETRLLGGRGAKFPNPDTGTGASWSTHDESRGIYLGLRRAGFGPLGDYRMGYILRCGFVDGQLSHCMWVVSLLP